MSVPSAASLNILFLEPFYGGSHKEFADGLKQYSRHRIQLTTMPDRNWKWRYRTSAFYFLQNPDFSGFDLILTSNMTDTALLKSFIGGQCPPVLLYFHESQLTYPPNSKDRIEYHYVLTEISSILAADYAVFNSVFHRQQFLAQLPLFLHKAPDYSADWIIPRIEAKTGVLYPGCRLTKICPEVKQNQLPVILWNHRWEYDKKPGMFLRVLRQIPPDFHLILLGEDNSDKSLVLDQISREFPVQILHQGFVANRKEYNQWLCRADIVVSTSQQENFGISIIEALAAGCLPLVPDKLSYPEVLPESLHSFSLYRTEKELIERLAGLVQNPEWIGERQPVLKTAAGEVRKKFDWPEHIGLFDQLFSSIAGNTASRQLPLNDPDGLLR